MFHFLKITGCILGCALALSAFAVEVVPRPRILTLPVPPYTIEAGPNSPGAFGEIVAAAAKRVEVNPIEIEFLPWARSQMISQAEPLAVIFPMDRSPEREAKYKWIAKLHCRPIGFIALSSFNGDLDHGEKLMEVRVGALRASPSLKELDEMKVTNVVEGRDFSDLAKLLQRQVIDVIYGSQDVSVYELAQAGIKPSEIKVGQPRFTRGLWLSANLAMPVSTQEKWKLALEQVKRDGTYKRILSKYYIAERSCQ